MEESVKTYHESILGYSSWKFAQGKITGGRRVDVFEGSLERIMNKFLQIPIPLNTTGRIFGRLAEGITGGVCQNKSVENTRVIPEASP